MQNWLNCTAFRFQKHSHLSQLCITYAMGLIAQHAAQLSSSYPPLIWQIPLNYTACSGQFFTRTNVWLLLWKHKPRTISRITASLGIMWKRYVMSENDQRYTILLRVHMMIVCGGIVRAGAWLHPGWAGDERCHHILHAALPPPYFWNHAILEWFGGKVGQEGPSPRWVSLPAYPTRTTSHRCLWELFYINW